MIIATACFCAVIIAIIISIAIVALTKNDNSELLGVWKTDTRSVGINSTLTIIYTFNSDDTFTIKTPLGISSLSYDFDFESGTYNYDGNTLLLNTNDGNTIQYKAFTNNDQLNLHVINGSDDIKGDLILYRQTSSNN